MANVSHGQKKKQEKYKRHFPVVDYNTAETGSYLTLGELDIEMIVAPVGVAQQR